MSTVKALARRVTPPLIWDAASRVRRRAVPAVFDGPLTSWAEAEALATGWESPAIVDKTLALSLKMRDGEIAFQQDTLVHERVTYSPTILAFLARASATGTPLDIIDFGGSLGTNYYQNRAIIAPAEARGSLKWRVVELPKTVALGRKHFANETLRFYDDWQSAADEAHDPKMLFTGSFQCVPDPLTLLDEVAGRHIPLIAFDRLLVSPAAAHEVYVQRPPARYYAATMPVWCFSRSAFEAEMAARGYDLIAEFEQVTQFAHVGLIFAHRPR